MAKTLTNSGAQHLPQNLNDIITEIKRSLVIDEEAERIAKKNNLNIKHVNDIASKLLKLDGTSTSNADLWNNDNTKDKENLETELKAYFEKSLLPFNTCNLIIEYLKNFVDNATKQAVKKLFSKIFAKDKTDSCFNSEGIDWKQTKSMLWDNLCQDGHFSFNDENSKLISGLLKENNPSLQQNDLAPLLTCGEEHHALATFLELDKEQQPFLYHKALGEQALSSETFWQLLPIFWPQPSAEEVKMLQEKYPTHMKFLENNTKEILQKIANKEGNKNADDLWKLENNLGDTLINSHTGPLYKFQFLPKNLQAQLLQRTKKNGCNLLTCSLSHSEKNGVLPLLEAIEKLDQNQQAAIFNVKLPTRHPTLAPHLHPEHKNPLYKAITKSGKTEFIKPILKIIEKFEPKDLSSIIQHAGNHTQSALELLIEEKADEPVIRLMIKQYLNLLPEDRIKLYDKPLTHETNTNIHFQLQLLHIITQLDKKIIELYTSNSDDKTTMKWGATTHFRDKLCTNFTAYLDNQEPNLANLKEQYETLLNGQQNEMNHFRKWNLPYSIFSSCLSCFYTREGKDTKTVQIAKEGLALFDIAAPVLRYK